MWKKENKVSPPPPATNRPARPVSEKPKSQPVAPPPSATDSARIGPKVVVKGDIYGEEDLIIEGQVEGTITLEKHGVVIAPSGRLTADVFADNIRVAGTVNGNLTAANKVVLLESAHLEGNVNSRTVTIETGAHFRGNVDMEGARKPSETTTQTTVVGKTPGSEEKKSSGATHPVGAAS